VTVSLASRVFTIDDIKNHLLGLAWSLRASPIRQTPHNAAYRQGYMDALLAAAISLGIADDNSLSQQQEGSQP
jgi:hypothetical protein